MKDGELCYREAVNSGQWCSGDNGLVFCLNQLASLTRRMAFSGRLGKSGEMRYGCNRHAGLVLEICLNCTRIFIVLKTAQETSFNMHCESPFVS